MSLKRLGIVRPTANTDVLLTDVNMQYFASVIITNLTETQTANLTIYVKPSGAVEEIQCAYVMFNFPLKPFNTVETNRFALNAHDEVWVKSSIEDVSFVAEGIPQPSIAVRYSTGPSASFPTNPVIGDQFFNTTANELNVFTSTGWKVLDWKVV